MLTQTEAAARPEAGRRLSTARGDRGPLAKQQRAPGTGAGTTVLAPTCLAGFRSAPAEAEGSCPCPFLLCLPSACPPLAQPCPSPCLPPL